MTDIIIGTIRQVATSANGATASVGISYTIDGILPDFVQLYAVNAAAADPSLVGPASFVQDFDVSPPEFQYYQMIELQAGTIYTLFLCPRTGTPAAPDDEIDGDYWEASCAFQTFTTTTHQPSGSGAVPPTITSAIPEPAKVGIPNSITISWSTPTQYDEFQIRPTYEGQALEQQQTTSTSWSEETAQGKLYTFMVQGGTYGGLSGYNWWAWGPIVSVTAAENLRSLKAYLTYSEIDTVGVKLSTYIPKGGTLRGFMQL